MRRLALILPALVLSACTLHDKSTTEPPSELPEVKTQTTPPPSPPNPPPVQINLPQSPALYGDFAGNPEVQYFIERMVSQHQFDRQQLYYLLGQARELDWVIRLMDKQAPTGTYVRRTVPNGSWLRYRKNFITPDNVQKGVLFWEEYAADLQRAQAIYGVPPEIIVGIIGVETRWGRIMGKTRIIDALATLAFAYPRRAEFFTSELEHFLLQTRQYGLDPLDPQGSYAGAMGYGQFMPSSYNKYAVDFDGDGRIDLWNPRDAIGSVANYFKGHGWTTEDLVAVPAKGQTDLQDGFNTLYPLNTLSISGLSPQYSLGNHQEASLLRLDMGSHFQYWYGLPNFYVITRYNHSTHYAMAVWELGQAVQQARR